MVTKKIPDATVYRLSLYHCYLGELHRVEGPGKVTSSRLAAELRVSEETVRRDLSYIGGVGRPGSGYQSDELLKALEDFLGIESMHPVIRVGSAQMIAALDVVFPPDAYGLRPVAYFSENLEDRGVVVDGIAVQHLDEMVESLKGVEVTVALVACSPKLLDHVLELLSESGIYGVLLLTPSTKLKRPEGMEITHVRMPCDLKSLACRCRPLVEKA